MKKEEEKDEGIAVFILRAHDIEEIALMEREESVGNDFSHDIIGTPCL